MLFTETPLAGAWLLELERREDERGFFARTYCADEFAHHGINPTVRQANTSFNSREGTLRGMHWQVDPHGETKLVRCTRGAIYDVIVDLRPHSPTYCRWYGAELTADNGRELYIPTGMAHGFQTLADDTEVLYLMGADYVPEAARGARWDDPAFGIEWPETAQRTISDKDQSYAPFVP